MTRGIIIFGASGSGTTTLGKELALYHGFTHFDLDDYFWRWDTEIPFTIACPREERIKRLVDDIANHKFVMSGSICGWDEPFIPLFELAVFVTAPPEIRVKRLAERELARFGERVREGGDMYDEHQHFLSWASKYDTMEPPERCLKLHEQWAETLLCPVLRVDGTTPVSENIAKIIDFYNSILRSGLEPEG